MTVYHGLSNLTFLNLLGKCCEGSLGHAVQLSHFILQSIAVHSLVARLAEDLNY